MYSTHCGLIGQIEFLCCVFGLSVQSFGVDTGNTCWTLPWLLSYITLLVQLNHSMSWPYGQRKYLVKVDQIVFCYCKIIKIHLDKSSLIVKICWYYEWFNTVSQFVEDGSLWVRGPLKSKSIELHDHRKRFLAYAPISNYMKNVRNFQFFMDKYFMLNKKDCFNMLLEMLIHG